MIYVHFVRILDGGEEQYENNIALHLHGGMAKYYIVGGKL